MTNGQIQQLRDLSKCHGMTPWEKAYVSMVNQRGFNPAPRMGAWDKALLRRLTHAYRNQIRAIKRNQERA